MVQGDPGSSEILRWSQKTRSSVAEMGDYRQLQNNDSTTEGKASSTNGIVPRYTLEIDTGKKQRLVEKKHGDGLSVKCDLLYGLHAGKPEVAEDQSKKKLEQNKKYFEKLGTRKKAQFLEEKREREKRKEKRA